LLSHASVLFEVIAPGDNHSRSKVKTGLGLRWLRYNMKSMKNFPRRKAILITCLAGALAVGWGEAIAELGNNMQRNSVD